MVEMVSEDLVERIFLWILECLGIEIDSDDSFDCGCEQCEYYEYRCRCNENKLI